jgi:hypothetical protein
VVDEHDAAQAVELVRALCDQLHAMIRQLSRLERQGVTGTNGRASATIRREAAALRRDISKAQFLIDRLQRRYLNGNGRARPPEQPRRSAARLRLDRAASCYVRNITPRLQGLGCRRETVRCRL